MSMTIRLMRRTILSATVAVSLLASAASNAIPISADSLGLTQGDPDIQSNFLDFSYDVGTGAFDIQSAFGGAQYTFAGASENILNSGFSITGNADGSDANLHLEITGEVSSIGGGQQILLSGDLASFSSTGNGVFEFLFGGLSGAFASIFGDYAGVIFTDGELQNFNFSSDFSSSMGDSDTFSVPVPEPAGFGLLVLAMTSFGMYRRRTA